MTKGKCRGVGIGDSRAVSNCGSAELPAFSANLSLRCRHRIGLLRSTAHCARRCKPAWAARNAVQICAAEEKIGKGEGCKVADLNVALREAAPNPGDSGPPDQRLVVDDAERFRRDSILPC
jgi:hypothetical protein